MDKKCTSCGWIKPIDSFHRRPYPRQDRQASCNSCRGVKQKKYLASITEEEKHRQKLVRQKWKSENKDKVKEAARISNAKNPTRGMDWAKNNKDRMRALCKKWRDMNPDKIGARNSTYRMSKLNGSTSWEPELDEFVVSEAYLLSSIRSRLFGTKYAVDHIVPLVSEKVCGLHNAYNLSVITLSENVRKSNRFWPDMTKEGSEP
jgi:hypothetical protein